MPGATSALAALIKSIITKTYLLHYGAEFLPFLEMVSGLKDKDASWALKVEEESSDSSSISDEEHSFLVPATSPRPASPPPVKQEPVPVSTPTMQPGFARERKASLPLTAKALIAAPSFNSTNPSPRLPHREPEDANVVYPVKFILRYLQATSQSLQIADPSDIAQEITRIQCQFFLRIEVWFAISRDVVIRFTHLFG